MSDGSPVNNFKHWQGIVQGAGYRCGRTHDSNPCDQVNSFDKTYATNSCAQRMGQNAWDQATVTKLMWTITRNSWDPTNVTRQCAKTDTDAAKHVLHCHCQLQLTASVPSRRRGIRVGNFSQEVCAAKRAKAKFVKHAKGNQSWQLQACLAWIADSLPMADHQYF
eukprot:1158437-Pelagomonas_calceolata.AAC.7